MGELGNGAYSSSPTPSPVVVSGWSRGSEPLARYGYRGDGLRSTKKVAGGTKAFTWDESGGLPLLLSDGVATFVYGPGGLPIEQVDGAGNVL